MVADPLKRNIVGMDLAGNKAEFEASEFLGIFREARESGLHTSIHAGEWAGVANVRQGLEVLGAERIGHGVRIMEDAEVVSLARDSQVVFEVCLTSNMHTGVVALLEDHPLMKMIGTGLNITLNTDDLSISQITLGNECQLACETIGMNLTVLKERILVAARGSFLPADLRLGLINKITQELYS